MGRHNDVAVTTWNSVNQTKWGQLHYVLLCIIIVVSSVVWTKLNDMRLYVYESRLFAKKKRKSRRCLH